jgi:hypothetical protein
MKEILLVAIGGVCSVMGGCIALWYQAKKARQIRMEEVRGEQQLEACKKALSLIGQIKRSLLKRTTDNTLKFLYDNDEWFSMNQILLPHTFVENWRAIMLNLNNMKLFEQAVKEALDGSETKKQPVEDGVKTWEYTLELAKDAEEILRKELNLPEVNLKTPETKWVALKNTRSQRMFWSFDIC